MKLLALVTSVVLVVMVLPISSATPTAPIVYVSANNDGDYNCDGVDDHVQINQALQYVNDNKGSGFTTVYLKNDGGTNDYIITDTIVIHDDTILTGADGVRVKLKDNIVEPSTIEWSMVTGATSVPLHDYGSADNITVSWITFDADRWNQPNIPTDHLDEYCTIEIRGTSQLYHNLTFEDGIGDFIKLPNYNENSPDFEVRDCTFGRSGHCGVFTTYTGYTGNSRIWIHDNDFTYVAANTGVRFDECAGVICENNTFTSNNQGDHAIYFVYPNDPCNIGSQDNIVRYNEIYDVREYGIGFFGHSSSTVVSESDNNSIHHNLIYRSVGSDGYGGGIAIYAHSADVEYNTIADGDGDGISIIQRLDATSTTGFVINAENNIVSGMDSYNSRGYGIANYATAGHTLNSDYNCFYDNDLGNYKNVDIGTYDIFSNPKFYNATAGKYYLNSTATSGTYNGIGWETMGTFSPCIDAADPSDPYSNEPEENGDRANMGRWGNTAYASRNSWGFDNTHLYEGVQVTVYTNGTLGWNYENPTYDDLDISPWCTVVCT